MNIYIILFSISIFVLWKIYYHIKAKRSLQRRMEIGKIGEEETIQILEQLSGKKQILRNLYIPMKSGIATTEIDAVMIHAKGIFVIENKNYAGKIIGKENDYQWTQIRRQNGKRIFRTFYNPIRQNEGHIRHLKQLLENECNETYISRLPYISLITFNDRARLGHIKIRSSDVVVLENRKLRRKLWWKLLWMRKRINGRQIEKISKELRRFENPGKHIQKQHSRFYKRF